MIHRAVVAKVLEVIDVNVFGPLRRVSRSIMPAKLSPMLRTIKAARPLNWARIARIKFTVQINDANINTTTVNL